MTKRVTAFLLLAALVYLLFFHQLAGRDLWGSHEARAAQNAASILDSGDWLLPRLADERAELQKPPLYYWLVAAIGQLRGRVDALAVRLPATLSATLCVIAVAFSLIRRGRPAAAFAASLLLVTAQHFTWLARTARIDMPLALCVTTAVLTIGLERRWQVLGYLAIAAAVLLKGPIGLALPLAVLIPDRLIEQRLNQAAPHWHSLRWGLMLVGAVALPWFLLVDLRTNGEFFRVFFWYHNINRAAGGAEELAVHPWWYYGPRLLVDALPGSLLLVPAFLFLSRNRRWRQDREARFGALWLVMVVGLLSCARFKRADYLLPAYPGMALMLGCVAEHAVAAMSSRVRRLTFIGTTATVTCVVAAWCWIIGVEQPRREAQREHRTFAQAIRAIAPAPQQVLLFRVECHPLAFHLGRPLNTFVEWENLDVWAGRPATAYIVMSPGDAARWHHHVTAGRLVEVCRNTDFSGGSHEKPLVLMRTEPRTHGAPREQTVDCQRPDQHGLAGPEPGSDRGTSRTGVDQCPDQVRPTVRAASNR